jgi:predicted aldo/keto reductase-like oxidoreductase
MARDIEASLLNLQTEYIDLYQCHNVRFDEDEATIFGADGAMEALLAAQQAGKIRHIGLTCHQVDRALRLIQTGKFATVQVPYNFNEDLAATELLPLAEKLGIGVIVMKPLGGGALPAEAAIRYFLDKPVSTVIPGMDSLCQVKDNIEYINSGQALNAEEMAKIADIKKEIGQKYCRRCDYCRPCPQGIDISGLFIVHGYYSRYSMQNWALSRYSSFAVKPDACIECGICESRCPYDLPIRQMLKQVYQDMN